MKRVRPGDWIAAVLIFTLATGIWAAGRSQSSGSLTALVRQDGQVVRTIALTGLSEPITFTLDGAYTNTIRRHLPRPGLCPYRLAHPGGPKRSLPGKPGQHYTRGCYDSGRYSPMRCLP